MLNQWGSRIGFTFDGNNRTAIIIIIFLVVFGFFRFFRRWISSLGREHCLVLEEELTVMMECEVRTRSYTLRTGRERLIIPRGPFSLGFSLEETLTERTTIPRCQLMDWLAGTHPYSVQETINQTAGHQKNRQDIPDICSIQCDCRRLSATKHISVLIAGTFFLVKHLL